ncbi:MAG: hypothetical protein WAN81_23965 [Candidatus Binataceae bacterium]
MDGKEVAHQTMERTVPLILQWDETFDIGEDTGTPVDDHDYQVPFKFTGKIDKLTIKIDRPKLTPEDEQRLMQGEAVQPTRNKHVNHVKQKKEQKVG